MWYTKPLANINEFVKDSFFIRKTFKRMSRVLTESVLKRLAGTWQHRRNLVGIQKAR
jgi:hypothetical protein